MVVGVGVVVDDDDDIVELLIAWNVYVFDETRSTVS
jgi:hypothetical protein